MTDQPLPILYSFRRCPYAMRARLALVSSGQQVILREVSLKNKPAQLIQISAKATVPVLHTADGHVIDESLDIMRWALAQHDPQHWLQNTDNALSDQLIAQNDGEFKYYLDRYKYADRYPENSEEFYRQQAEKTLLTLEQLLDCHSCLLGSDWQLADMAILPFLRQFAAVDSQWFAQAPYPRVRAWLHTFLESTLFNAVMTTYPVWENGQEPQLFP